MIVGASPMRRAFVLVAVLVAAAVVGCGGGSKDAKLTPVILGTSLQRVYEVAEQEGCDAIGSACDGSYVANTDCQDAGGSWACGVFSRLNGGEEFSFEYDVTVKGNCWKAVEDEKPDEYKFLGRLHGCVGASDRSAAADADEDGDGYDDSL
jgi:hypothetical protein